MQAARNLTNARNPEAALASLRDALTVVQSADNIPEDSRRRLENEVRNAIGATEQLEERITIEKAEEYRIAASQAARSNAVDRLVRTQDTTATLMAEFDSLMNEGYYRVFASGGLADIEVTRQPFVDARFRAQAARALDPYALAPWAGMYVSDAVGFFSQSIQYDRLKEYRAMLTWSDVDRTSVPFPDSRVIEYPERAAWQALSERRIARYGDADYLFDRDEKTKAILKKLGEPLSMNFATDTPLADVKKYIQDATQDEAAGLPTGIPIYVDPVGLQDADKTMADTVTINLEGIPLKTTLRLLLKQLSLTYTVKDGLLTITSTSTDDQPTEIRVYQVADLAPFRSRSRCWVPAAAVWVAAWGGGMAMRWHGRRYGWYGRWHGRHGRRHGWYGRRHDGWYGRHDVRPAPGPRHGSRQRFDVRGKKKQLNAISQIPPNPQSLVQTPRAASPHSSDRPWSTVSETRPRKLRGQGRRLPTAQVGQAEARGSAAVKPAGAARPGRERSRSQILGRLLRQDQVQDSDRGGELAAPDRQ